MAAPTTAEAPPAGKGQAPAEHQPYVPDHVHMPEFTWSAVLVGAILGIIFGASSLYLVLKVGMTVSASIPVAVLSITLFRAFSRAFGIRRATILENNIVQTAGSAGESIAFGVGVTMPALMLLGFDMDIGRIMLVSILGGTLGILMMIPLRRAFIVKLHGRPGEPGKLLYPEGTACADVLISGEKGGTSGKTVFVGFGLAFVHKFLTEGLNVLAETVGTPLKAINRAARLSGEMASELLGVGYIIGFRTSSVMMAGAVLGYLVIIPVIAMVGDYITTQNVPPGTKLIKDMDVKELRNNYLLFIGAGCVATAGIISMCRTLPMIVRSLGSGLTTLRGARGGNGEGRARVPRTENDLPLSVVLFGSLGLLAVLAVFMQVEVGVVSALLGALLVILFGFLFVTVSSRLTGEIGSSSNPISGMTVATLLLTCLIFLSLGMTSPTERILALSIGAVVCIAASNGGTTSQDLKTGYLVGATPKLQQYAILIGSLTSAVVIGGTLMLFNAAGTVYSADPQYFPSANEKLREQTETQQERGETLHVWPFQEHEPNSQAPTGGYLLDDQGRVRYLTKQRLALLTRTENYKGKTYHAWWAGEPDFTDDKPRKYLVDDQGQVHFYVDPAIMGKLSKRVTEDGREEEVKLKFDAPKTEVMGLIINGVLKRDLNWMMVLMGAMISITLELCGVSSLAFAVGVYVDIKYSVPVFIGGLARYAIDRFLRPSPAVGAGAEGDAEARARAEVAAIAETETSPAVLLASGYIAGGSLGGVLIAFLEFAPKFKEGLDFTGRIPHDWLNDYAMPLLAFAFLIAVLLLVGAGKLFRAGPEGEGRTQDPTESPNIKE